jgi:aminopeptidase YwaD
MPDVAAVVERLCAVQPDRRPGGEGNREAVAFVSERFGAAGWDVSWQDFECLDWESGPAFVEVRCRRIRVEPAPYGLGVDACGPIRVVSQRSDLGSPDLHGALLVVTGDLVAEPLTPKAFPFYGSEEHEAIIALLESIRPVAVVAVTGKHPALCGALDPYPWIEDGDFAIPAAAVRTDVGASLLEAEGDVARIHVESTRTRSSGSNVVAFAGPPGPRLTVCAHVDSKPGTPGAVDNAAGVAALVALADRLEARTMPIGVELLAVNGEDHYAGPGEVAWLKANEGRLDEIELFVNIDAAGYRRGRTAFSLYNVSPDRSKTIRGTLARRDELIEGPAWYQSDHAILAMQGRPALAFTTEYVNEMLEALFHAPTDTPDQVSPSLIDGLVDALAELIGHWA